MNAGAEKLIARLGLAPLPVEGGYFRQIWLSDERQADGRPTGSRIWFLMTESAFSALHRLDAAEQWEFQAGDPVEHVQLVPQEGAVHSHILSRETNRTLMVPVGVWQGARLAGCPKPRGWALLSCSMTPAWREKGFEAGERDALRLAFPTATALITSLTR